MLTSLLLNKRFIIIFIIISLLTVSFLSFKSFLNEKFQNGFNAGYMQKTKEINEEINNKINEIKEENKKREDIEKKEKEKINKEKEELNLKNENLRKQLKEQYQKNKEYYNNLDKICILKNEDIELLNK